MDSYYIHNRISTHAPRTGSDFVDSLFNEARLFQPTLPARGATSALRWLRNQPRIFQPTLPARGATLSP